jgi:hypothetical protein
MSFISAPLAQQPSPSPSPSPSPGSRDDDGIANGGGGFGGGSGVGGGSGGGGFASGVLDPRVVMGGFASGARSAPPMAEHVHLFAGGSGYGRPWDTAKLPPPDPVAVPGIAAVTDPTGNLSSTSVNPAGNIGEGSRSNTPISSGSNAQPLPIDLIQADFPRTPSPLYAGLAAGSAARRKNDLNAKLMLRSLPPVRGSFKENKRNRPRNR